MRVTIADSMFLQYGKTAKLGGGNAGLSPTYFEWELADPTTARFVTDSHIKNAKGSGQVALLLESFFLHPENYVAAMEKPFDYVLTHNGYFTRNKDWLWYPGSGSWVNFNAWKVYEKSKNVSILLSPKRTMSGHRFFHEIVEKYESKFDGVYGLKSYAQKLEALSTYRFSVVCEAEYVEGFFSEKLIDCLSVGTIPIYWGCPNIAEFFDERGIIQVKNIKQVESALNGVDEKEYSRRMASVETNLDLARYYAIIEDWIYEHYPFLFAGAE